MVTILIQQYIRLDHHTRAWKKAKGVMLYKSNKLDFTTVNAYKVISLVNSLGKVCEKVVADMLVELFEINHVLHEC